MRELLQKALKKADQAEIFFIKVEKYPVKFAGNKLKSIKSSISQGVSLRVIHNNKLGFSADTGLNNPDQLVERALTSAELGSECAFDFCKSDRVTPVDIFDPRTVSFEIEEAVEMGQKMIDYVTKKAPDTVNDLNITRYFIEVSYFTDGVEKTFYKTLITRSLSSMKVNPDGLIYIDESDSSCRLPSDTLAPARRVAEKYRLVKKSLDMPSRPTPVIFHPKAVSNLVYPLIAGLSGKNLVSGTSPLINKFNRWILDQRFSLADDPTIALGFDSEGFDGEGMPRIRNVLFDRGVLSNYLLDLHSANVLGFEPNACAHRDISSPPTPSSSNLVITGGEVPVDDMISDIKHGLIVEEVIGGGQSNTIAGEFSFNVSLGFRINKGKIQGRVKNTMVAGNVYELLKNNLEALSTETMTEGSITTPYFLIRDVSVSGNE